MKALLFGLLVLVSGCTSVKQGELGILQHFNGSIDDEAAGPGFHTSMFDSYITVDATEVRVPVDKIQPKDKDGVLVSTSITATYKLNPEKAIAFYKQTHELDQVKENDSTIRVLGYQVLQQEINNSAQKAFSDFQVSEMVPRKMELEAKLKEILQKKLDGRYADAFIVTNVNINETRLGDAVEQVLQAQAIAKSQSALLDLQMKLAEKETDLLNKKFDGLKAIAARSGVPVQAVMDFKLREQSNLNMSELAKHSAAVQVQVPAGK